MLFLLNGIKQYRKSFFIFLVAGLTSLSFTFYVFLAIFLLWNSSHFNIKTLSYIAIGLFFAFIMFGDNINQFIVERYQSGEYDDRASEAFMNKYDDFLHSSDVWFGKGEGAVKDVDDGGVTVGFRREVYEVGVVGIFLIFVAFSYPLFKMSKINKFILLYFAVFWMSYYSTSNVYHSLKIMMFFSVPAIALYREQELLKEKYNNK